jgi:hypothetical protein
MSGDDEDRASETSADLGDANRVGYGKPPLSSRFKPGQSGNPRGKRKRQKALKTIVREAIYEKVEVNTPRGPKRMSKLAVTVHTMVNNAAKGDAKAREQMFRYMTALGLERDFAGMLESSGAEQLTEDDKAILARFGLGDGGPG